MVGGVGEALIMRRSFERPVYPFVQPLLVKKRALAGAKLLDPLENAVSALSRGTQQHKRCRALLVQRRTHLRASEQRLYLGREHDTAVVQVIEKRFYAGTVTGEEKPSVTLIPDREGVYAVETVKTALAPFRERLQQHLGVA